MLLTEKKENMGTSQSHNLKSGPNWSTAKRSVTSIANGSGNLDENCRTFIAGLSSAISKNIYRGTNSSHSSFGHAGARVSKNFISLIGAIRSQGLSSILGSDFSFEGSEFKRSFKEAIIERVLGEHDSSMDDAAAAKAFDKVLDEILKDCETKDEIDQKLSNASNDDLVVWIIDFQIDYIIEYSGEIFQSHIFDKCDNPDKVMGQIRNWLHSELDDRLKNDVSKYNLTSSEGIEIVKTLTADILDIWKQE